MGTHPIFESDFDCLTDLRLNMAALAGLALVEVGVGMMTAAVVIESNKNERRSNKKKVTYRVKHSPDGLEQEYIYECETEEEVNQAIEASLRLGSQHRRAIQYQ